MDVTIGTFNLNNLFSRFNFQGVIDELQNQDGPAGALTVRYEFTDTNTFRIRTFRGRLVESKDAVDTQRIAERILRMDVDVLAVQEVENIHILREFNRDMLGGLYRHQVLIEGNDPRFIDVGILSKLPIGAVTSHQTAVHRDDPARPVFGRDLLAVEILNSSRSRKLFTLYNNHLKSNFVPHDVDPVTGAAAANARRQRQAEVVARIVENRERPNSRFIIAGDMNDPVDSPFLAPLTQADGLGLVDALTDPEETRPAKAERHGPGAQTTAWTHRFIRTSGQPPEFDLYDQIWLSPGLASRQTGAFIDRRRRHGGDGSDHEPAWVALAL